MKKAFGFLAAGVLAACSSSSSNNNGVTPPTPTSYTYGTGTPVASGSQQDSAAQTANSDTEQDVTVATQGNVQNNASQLSSAPFLPDDVVGSLGVAQAAMKDPAYAVVGKVVRATRSGSLDTGCYTVSGNTITYNNCNSSGTGFTYTINGTLTATTTSLTWNIKVSFNISDSSATEDFNGTWAGNFTFASTSTDTTVDGTASSAWTVAVTSSSGNENVAYTAQIVFKALDVSTTCDDGGGIISGKMDVSVTAVASNGTAAQDGFENFGYEFTWNGCDTIAVATGTAG
jgi:hypothetical protein